MAKANKLSTSPYKGTRDFFPDDMRIRNWMFGKMREVVESYAYQEYDGPMLEPFELYVAKSGEEIVQRQLYNFVDKGEREVAIRPEMTPTVARMVASKLRELPKPIRWFSFPNLWRYEQPGRGRLREHWQLNVDLFGLDSNHAEVEIIQIATDILKNFGAPKNSFRVLVSHRGILDSFLKSSLGLEDSQAQAVSKILDKKNKIPKEEFEGEIASLLPKGTEQLPLVYEYLDSDLESVQKVSGIDSQAVQSMKEILDHSLRLLPETDIIFDPSIVRGFDYYTGFIFEIFDTNPENRRSLYGGGRYDNLIGLFSNESLSGIGFGLGDVTLQNFLEGHGLVPELNLKSTLFVPLLSEDLYLDTMQISRDLRNAGISVETMLDGNQKLGKQISLGEKKGYRFVLLFGESEKESGSVIIKDLHSGEQLTISLSELTEKLKREYNL